jgi:prepilin-type N-terminal cleavage/methylation domain-containing protein/prepilin-type processing-associated H-X9-DG protein
MDTPRHAARREPIARPGPVAFPPARRGHKAAFALVEPFDRLRTHQGERAAFTLIELLIVIAIISLLLTLLMPSLNQAKELAQSAACSSNLRNLAIPEHIYASEYQDVLPSSMGDWEIWTDLDDDSLRWGVYTGYYGGWYRPCNVWTDILYFAGMIDSRDLAQCPAKSWTDSELAVQKGEPANADHPRLTGRGPQSYGMNAYMDEVTWTGVNDDLDNRPWYEDGAEFRPVSRVENPQKKVLLCESPEANPTVKVYRSFPHYHPDAIRHLSDSASYGFLDGHVESLSIESMFGLPYEPGDNFHDLIFNGDHSRWELDD